MIRTLAPSIVNMDIYTPLRQWTGYVLRCYNKTMYVGMTNQIDVRIKQHINRDGGKFTKRYKPLSVVELYFCKTKKEASYWESRTRRELQRMYPDRLIGGSSYLSKQKSPLLKYGIY